LDLNNLLIGKLFFTVIRYKGQVYWSSKYWT